MPADVRPASVVAAEALLSLDPDADLLTNWSSETEPFARLQTVVLDLLREHPLTARSVVERVERSGSLSDPLHRLLLVRMRAHVAKATGELPVALERYAHAYEGLLARGQRVEAARTVIGWSDALALAGEPREAFAKIADARRALDRSASEAAIRLEGTEATIHYVAGRLDHARELYARARDRARRRGRDVDAAVCTFNLANVELLRGNVRRARRHYETARQVFESHGAGLAVLQCRYGLAATGLHQGRWRESAIALEAVADEIRERGDRRGAAAIDHETAELLASVGADPLAEIHARRAHTEFAAMGLGPEKSRAAVVHGRTLARLGRVHDAHRRLEEAEALFAAMGRKDAVDRIVCARFEIDVERGVAVDDAALQAAWRRVERRDDRPTALRLLVVRAENARLRGRPHGAVRLVERALERTKNPASRGLRPFVLMIAARSHGDMGRSQLAVQAARRAVRDQEYLAQRMGPGAESLGFGRAREHLAAQAIEIVLTHAGEDAARIGLRLLMTLRAGSVVDDLLRDRRRVVRDDIALALARLRDRLLESGGGAKDVRSVSLRAEADRLERRLHSVSASVRAEATPALRARDFAPRTWVRRAGDCPVVTYHRPGQRRNDRWSAFVVERSGRTRHVDLPDAADVLREHWIPLRMLFETIARAPHAARQRLMERTIDEARASLAAVAHGLWTPLDIEDEHALVVSNRTVDGIALESALLDARGDDAPVLSRVPHPALLLDAVPRRARRALLVEGTVPGARDELDRIDSILRRDGWETLHVRTRAEFDRLDGRFGLIHFATHGSYHRSRWVWNGLQLEDGWLGFEQLSRLRGRGALMVFDSCESGLANEVPGAELDGWASAAFAAGAAESMLHLWKVDDASATQLMTAFYESVSSGASTSEAAHAARHAVRASHPHPYVWGSAIVASRLPATVPFRSR